jgi:putative tricarboxylic transport membrane protein
MVLRLQRAAAYIIILGVAIYLWIVAENFQYERVPGRIGPDAWPKIVLVLLVATCLWQIARVVIFGAQPVPADEVDEEAPIVPPDAGNFVHLAWLGIAITAAYAYLMPHIGFFASTVVFVAAIACIAGRYRKPVPLIVTSLIAPIVLMFIFMRVTYIALPLGHGAFKELSLMLLKGLGVH